LIFFVEELVIEFSISMAESDSLIDRFVDFFVRNQGECQF
jgi:hypothetical protein